MAAMVEACSIPVAIRLLLAFATSQPLDSFPVLDDVSFDILVGKVEVPKHSLVNLLKHGPTRLSQSEGHLQDRGRQQGILTLA